MKRHIRQIPFHLALLCLSLCVTSCSKKNKDSSEPSVSPRETTQHQTPAESTIDLPNENEIQPDEQAVDITTLKEFRDADAYMENLAETITKAQEQNNAELLTTLFGDHSLSPEQTEHLQQLIRENNLQLDLEKPLERIGELKTNKHARWAINLKDKPPIVLDVKRDAKGNWKVDKITLPKDSLAAGESPLPNSKTDALNYTHNFIQQLLKQDFSAAKGMVDKTNITDAKLAGLCIIFEEAEYQINPEKPLRTLFLNEKAAGFYVNVISKTGEKAAQFSVIAQREKAGDPWEIYEINLDQLLTDYAARVSGGDTYYTPLLKNPKGGDSLVIYFEFDSEGLTPRTQKQLDIVTSILRLDKKNTITVSGHTDAIGDKAYNATLSEKRALSVRDYFAANGVAPEQVVLESHGAAIPRQPNTLQDGSDNPQGRRANRRTEIYLDF